MLGDGIAFLPPVSEGNLGLSKFRTGKYFGKLHNGAFLVLQPLETKYDLFVIHPKRCRLLPLDAARDDSLVQKAITAPEECFHFHSLVPMRTLPAHNTPDFNSETPANVDEDVTELLPCEEMEDESNEENMVEAEVVFDSRKNRYIAVTSMNKREFVQLKQNGEYFDAEMIIPKRGLIHVATFNVPSGLPFRAPPKMSEMLSRSPLVSETSGDEWHSGNECDSLAHSGGVSAHEHGHVLLSVSKLEQYRESDEKEFGNFLKYGVFEQESQVGIRCVWLRSMRLKNGKLIPKSRLVAQGFRDTRNDLITYVDLPSSGMRKLGHIFGLTRKLQCAFTDVSTAFLQVRFDSNSSVAVTLPSVLPKCALSSGLVPGRSYLLNAPIYALKDSPKVFVDFLKERLKSIHWKHIGGGMFTRRTALLMAYVDDICVWSSQPVADICQIQKVIDCDDPQQLGGGSSFRYVGEAVTLTSTNELHFTLDTYLRGFGDSYSSVRGNFTKLDLTGPEESEQVGSSMLKDMQSENGRLGWIAGCHPAVAYRFGELSRWILRPTTRLLNAIKKVLRDCCKGMLSPLVYTGVTDPEFRIFTDASFKSSEFSSRIGWIAYLQSQSESVTRDHNLIAWKSKTDERKHKSTASAEINAVIAGLHGCAQLVKTAGFIFGDVCVRVFCDNATVVTQIHNGKSTSDPLAQGSIDFVLQVMRDLRATIEWIETTKMKADGLTKLKPMEEF